MNLRQEWMSDYEYFDGDYPNNVFIDDVKASYERRKSGTDGKSGKIDSVSATFVAQNHTNPLNKAKYDKKLLVDSTQSIHTGSVVEFDSKKWLVTNKIFDRQAYKVTSVNEIIVFLSLYKNGTTTQVPACVDNSIQLYRMGVEETRLLSFPEGVIILHVPQTSTTDLIEPGEIFTIGKYNYKVADIQDVIDIGLLILRMEKTTQSPEAIPATPLIQPIEISGADSMIKDSTAFYTTDYESPVVFSVQSGSASIVSQANNSCTVKAGKEVGEVVLKATSGKIFGTKKIKIKGLL